MYSCVYLSTQIHITESSEKPVRQETDRQRVKLGLQNSIMEASQSVDNSPYHTAIKC